MSGDTLRLPLSRHTAINPQSLGAPRGYSNGMLAPAGGRLLAIAGQIAWNAEQQIVSDDFAAQFAAALENVLTVVRTAGGIPSDILQLTIYIIDLEAYRGATQTVGEAWRRLMGRHYPAMALVEVAGLLEPRAQVEIQGLAVLPGESTDGD